MILKKIDLDDRAKLENNIFFHETLNPIFFWDQDLFAIENFGWSWEMHYYKLLYWIFKFQIFRGYFENYLWKLESLRECSIIIEIL